MLKTVLTIIGVAAVLVGLLWVGQGLGLVRWPASSFMIDTPRWSLHGAVLAILGLALIVYARRRRA
jgi:hypothetical protein